MGRATMTVGSDDEGEAVQVPARAEVCPRCEGTGRHVNPAVDGHGISSEEWEHEWDEEGREAYLAGRYDVTCESCGGNNVVLVPDVARCTYTQKRALVRERRARREHAQYLAEVAMERRMGA